MIKAKKSLGQNFLIDRNIIEKIVNTIDVKDRHILEIGPGTGNLTSSILNKKPKKIYVIEKDKVLSTKLQEIALEHNIHLSLAQILSFNIGVELGQIVVLLIIFPVLSMSM